jgi:3-oxoacyl-[acyl-carrier-protein] synthase II
MERKDAKRVDRFVQFALAASRLALADSGLVVGGENRDRVAVDIGTTLAGLETIEAGGRELRRGGPRRVSPYLIPGSFPNLASGWVSIRTGARGGTAATSCEGATSAQALGHSLRRLEAGEVDAVLAGGAEAPITPLGMSGFAAMRALSRRNDEPRRASRPFAVDRDGFVLAEGATILVLEALECAQRRGARILCELSGYGCAAASGRGRRAFADAALRSMRLALADAGAGSDGIDYVSAHAVGSRADDRAEADALRSLFADRASPVIVGASKSMTGHALGAAGAMSAGIATLALARGVIPPTLNLERPDPRCISGRIPGRSLAFQARAALCVALGLGGVAASLVLRRYG